MPNRVMLCAIAKNEGAYLTDWVFHHRYFGFDAVRVFINGSDDRSIEILEAIRAIDPTVGFEVVDDLYDECVRREKHFQRESYQRLARRAARRDHSHVAFFDLDEYWIPADLTTSVHAFLPDDDEVNVVSFSWCLDIPSQERDEFAPPVAARLSFQFDRHVKSIVRLDDRVQRFRTHTARTSSGTRLLVREPFPIRDERAQQWGSFLTLEDAAEREGSVPEAFILHAINRSKTEYIASLTKASGAKGRYQAPEFRGTYKATRGGYLPTAAPRLAVEFDHAAHARYERHRRSFHDAVGVGPLIEESEALVRKRAEELIRALSSDAALLDHLRGALQGVPAPILDGPYPGWNAGLDPIG